MKAFKVLHVVLFVVGMLFVAVCIYGWETDCPNTVGYVFCGKDDGLRCVGGIIPIKTTAYKINLADGDT